MKSLPATQSATGDTPATAFGLLVVFGFLAFFIGCAATGTDPQQVVLLLLGLATIGMVFGIPALLLIAFLLRR